MDQIVKNQGLCHIAEKIFLFLDVDSLKNCEKVNISWMEFLKNPKFWTKKLSQTEISEEIKTSWKLLIEKSKNERFFKEIKGYLIELIQGNPKFTKPISEKTKHCKKHFGFFVKQLSDECLENCKIPLNFAVGTGNLEMTKFIIEKPIDHIPVNIDSALNFAAFYGKIEVLKYLVDFIGYPNVLNGDRDDPIGVGYISPLYYGVCGGDLEVVKFFFRHYFPKSRYGFTYKVTI